MILNMAVLFKLTTTLFALSGNAMAVASIDNSSLSTMLKNESSTGFGFLEIIRHVTASASGVEATAIHSTDSTVVSAGISADTAVGDNARHTENVISVSNSAVYADSSVDESTSGQTADLKSVGSTPSAMISDVDETVILDLESIDTGTLSDSVFVRNVSGDFTTENVFTLRTSSSVPTNTTSLFTPSPVLSTKDCKVTLCEKDAGYFVINVTACLASDSPAFHTSIPTTVDILTQDEIEQPAALCYWTINVPEKHYVNLTIDQLRLSDDQRNGTQVLELSVEDELENKHVFNISVLGTRSVTITSSASLFFRFRSRNLHLASAITFHFHVQRGTIVMDLPVVRLTDTVSYVTSPRFNGVNPYPNSYEGAFHLHVSDNESVLISFTHFFVETDVDCQYDYLDLSVAQFNQTWRECGWQNIPPRVYRSSIKLFFHTDETSALTGFKMIYAILPRSQEPKRLSENLFNCSVPHFHTFRPVFSCNIVTECQEKEDEKDCSYHSNDCGDGALDTGTKCYRFVRRGGETTWSDANYECIRENQNLVTLATSDELGRFRRLMSVVRNPRPLYVGGQLVDRLKGVTIATLYGSLWQWVDGRTAFLINPIGSVYPPKCAYYKPKEELFEPTDCQRAMKADFVCEFDKENTELLNETELDFSSSASIDPDDTVWNVRAVQCSSGHMTRDFLACDVEGQCRAKESTTSCYLGSVTIPMFLCERSEAALHYTLVCDHIQHCEDNTDENFCHFSPCPFAWYRCRNGQCIMRNQVCDGIPDCYDGSDEFCPVHREIFGPVNEQQTRLNTNDWSFLKQVNKSGECSSTQFQCSQRLCLPIYLRCNGVDDCPNREDEASCDNYTCTGYYRCRGSKVCLHADHVCDGVLQCPQYDDELLCEEITCPDVCRCQGLAFICSANFSASSYPALRYLDASGSGMTPGDLSHNDFLIHLRLSDCRIAMQSILELPNLRHLDLSRNELTRIDMQHFHSLNNLRVLVLSGNPLLEITNTDSLGLGTIVLQDINLSRTSLSVFNGSALVGCPNLKVLNISFSKLTTVTQEGFKSTPLLENLDVRGSPLKDFPSDLLKGLASLRVVHSDNYKLCCKATLPEDFQVGKCHAEQDLLASCEDLLKSNVYRVFLWIFASLSIVGNSGSFVSRLYFSNKSAAPGSFNMFVTSLSVADFFMGVYLAIVGVADQIYRGQYFWRGDHWKKSVVCKLAGFLSLVSSEVSAFIICLITLDRFLALHFPFSNLRFSRSSALVACVIVWMIGIVLAAVPLLPVTSHWEFYGQTGICIPLPFSSRFQGYGFSFGVMIILNFVLFLLIALGQVFIYWSVHSNSVSSSMKRGSRDTAVARRLTTIVLSDFLCWFPIGLLGLLASTGTPIPGELNVAVAIFVMPFNSALNPFLYTFNVLMEKRLKAQEACLLKRLENRMYTDVTEHTHSDSRLKMSLPVNRSIAIKVLKTWLSEKVLTHEDILSCSTTVNGVQKDVSVNTHSERPLLRSPNLDRAQ